MATRSDFAQKLLIDLRMRKERMSTPSSHSTSNSKGTPRDSYGNPSQHHKGSRQTKSLESVDTRPNNSHRRSNHGAKSLVSVESSNQLVPYGGGRNSKQIGDLSSALALAFGNNKKFTKLNNSSSNNPILSFLHRIGRRALDIGKMERRNITSFNKSSSQIINVSDLHINEISKGVQKLNQILKGYSNSITFDGYSVEIGRELLKGAMDLEEMLTNIQDDSNQVANSRRKSRIKLLNEKGEEEEEEEESESVPQKKLIERPRFSFDKPSKNSKDAKQVLKSDPKRSLVALNYTTADTTLFRKQPSSTSDVAHHKRSASCGPEFRPQNGKIPNVIAKLMGLEDVPQSVNFESTLTRSSAKQKEGMVLKNNENINGKIVEKMIDNIEYVAPTDSGRKVMQNNYGIKFQNAKSLFKENERVGVTKPVSGPQLNEEFRRFNKSPNNLHVNMRRKEAEKHNKYIGVEKGHAKVSVDRNNKNAEGKIIKKGTDGVRIEKEKRNTEREEKSRVEKGEKQHMKENQVVPSKTTPKKLHDEKPYKVSTNSNLFKNGSPKNLAANTRNLMFLKSCRSGTPNEIVSKTKNSRGSNPPTKKEKPVNSVSIERERLQKKDKVVTKGKVTQEKGAVTLTDQISFLQKKEEVKLGKSIEGGAEILINSNSKDAEMHIVNHDNSEAKAKVLIDDLPSDKKANELHSPIVVPDLPILDESSQNMTTKISIDPIDDEDKLACLNEDTGLESQNIELDSENGCTEADMDNSTPQQHELKENPIPENDEILIESEINLKQTLLKSRLFLNTVNELFNFSIPVDFLIPTDNIIQDDDNKLILDCAYELTRKKGKRLELSLYPSIKIATVSFKVTSHNDLVKQLHTDFEKLKFVYEGTNKEHDSAEYIQEMLEIDVENRDTDVNAMWDLGWNEIMFAIIERDELIKDVEKYLIDVVIEDISKELLYLGGYIYDL